MPFAKQAIAVVTMVVHSLPMVLLRPMGLKLAWSVWSPFLYHDGVSPRIHMSMKSWCMLLHHSGGRAPSSSLGVPSGPGCLFLAMCLMHVWYVVVSITRSMSYVVCRTNCPAVSNLMLSGPSDSQGPNWHWFLGGSSLLWCGLVGPSFLTCGP